MPDILTVRQMQAALQIGRTGAYRLLQTSEIEYFKIGNSIRIPKESLIRYVREEQNMLKYKLYNEQGDCQSMKGETI